MKRQGWMPGLAVGALLLAAMPARGQERRREPRTCEARCDDESQRSREICKKYAGDGSEACLEACSEEENRCKRRCRDTARK